MRASIGTGAGPFNILDILLQISEIIGIGKWLYIYRQVTEMLFAGIRPTMKCL